MEPAEPMDALLAKKFPNKACLWEYLTCKCLSSMFNQIIGNFWLPEERYTSLNFLQSILEEKSKCFLAS